MYIEQAQKNLSDWWRYLIGGFIIFFFWQIIGGIPIITAILYKVGLEGLSTLEDPEKMFTVLENSSLTFFYLMLTFVIGLIGLLFTTKFLHNQTITNLTTSRSKIDWKRIAFAFFTWGLISVSMTCLDVFYFRPDEYLYNFNFDRFLILAVLAILLVPLQTSFEEYLFRGYLMQGIGNVTRIKKSLYYVLITIFCLVSYIYLIYNLLPSNIVLNIILFALYQFLIIKLFNLTSLTVKFIESNLYKTLYKMFSTYLTPLIFTSVVFGLMHIVNPEVDKLGYFIMIFYIGTGFFLGIITLMDEGLELALGFHAANNLFIALLITADWTAFQTDSIFKATSDPTYIGWNEFIANPLIISEIAIPVFVIFPTLLFIYSKKYNWSNWSDKLTGKVNSLPVSEQDVWGKR